MFKLCFHFNSIYSVLMIVRKYIYISNNSIHILYYLLKSDFRTPPLHLIFDLHPPPPPPKYKLKIFFASFWEMWEFLVIKNRSQRPWGDLSHGISHLCWEGPFGKVIRGIATKLREPARIRFSTYSKRTDFLQIICAIQRRFNLWSINRSLISNARDIIYLL